MKFEHAFTAGFNILGRLFGVLCLIGGIFFLISAYAVKENRPLNAVLGFCIIVMGIAFLITKSVRTDQIARMRRLMGRGD
jgi:uncharacterized membrane protein HdeD (DUF308 family)